MALLREAENQQGYLKWGIQGLAGTGKTWTASIMALELAKMMGNKPVAFVDTENGSDYMIQKFKKAGVKLLVAKTRAYMDLLTIMKEAQKDCAVLLVDSISHIWAELMNAYMAKKKITHLEFRNQNDISNEWQPWLDWFLNSPMHVGVCGRLGGVWKNEKDEETGKWTLINTGDKMKAKADFGHEPSLSIQMERVPKGNEPGAGVWHRAYIIKDRTGLIDGKEFDDPTIEAFRPVLNFLNLKGVQHGIDTERTSEAMFNGPETSRAEGTRRHKIVLDEIQETIVALWPGMAAKDKKAKGEAVLALFGVRSWAAVEALDLDVLEIALRVITAFDKKFDSGSPDDPTVIAHEIADLKSEALGATTARKEAESAMFGELDENGSGVLPGEKLFNIGDK